METKGFFQFGIILIICISQLFLLHLNTYAMGLRPLEMFNSFGAGTDFRRQNLTSKVDPRIERVDPP